MRVTGWELSENFLRGLNLKKQLDRQVLLRQEKIANQESLGVGREVFHCRHPRSSLDIHRVQDLCTSDLPSIKWGHNLHLEKDVEDQKLLKSLTHSRVLVQFCFALFYSLVIRYFIVLLLDIVSNFIVLLLDIISFY